MIVVRDLSFQYETDLSRGVINHAPTQVFDGIDLEIREGESVALMGPNGSGKTTLARCLNGLLIPTKGDVLVDGFSVRDPSQIWEIRRRVGMVFQHPDDQIVSTIVERDLAFGLENLGVPREEIARRVREALERFRLTRYRTHPPHRLSGGEKQRLAIAAVLAMRPRYVILDEPTSTLDPEGCREVMDALRELRADPEVAILHITQSPEEAGRADRIVVLGPGGVELDGPAARVFEQSDVLFRLGLDVPFARNVTQQLRGHGVSLPSSIWRTDDLVAALEHVRPAKMSSGGRNGRCDDPRAGKPGSHRVVTEALSHIYDRGLPTQRPGLTEVTLTIHSGEWLSLIGPTGSGKTTLVQHFNGLLRPTSGRVLVDGEDLWHKGTDLQSVRQKVGLIFQFPEFQLFEETVAADVAFGPRNLGWTEERVEESVRGALASVQLDPDRFGERSPFALSGGEKRRVAIAGVLAMAPEVVVLDEPTSGLDPQGAKQIVSILKRLHGEGRTIVLITHSMDLAASPSDRVAVLNEGRLSIEGEPRDVFRRSEMLRSLGLDVPDAMILAEKLRALGWPIPEDLLTLEEVVLELARVLTSCGRQVEGDLE